MSIEQSEQLNELGAALAKAQAQIATSCNPYYRMLDGFPQYLIHSSGEITSSYRGFPRPLKGMSAGRGYRVVTLISVTGKQYRVYLHRLVAMAFLPFDKGKPQVNHKDGNKLNNAVNNLEWCSPAENLAHARLTGLNDLFGLKNPCAKFTGDQVEQIKSLRSTGLSYSKIAARVGCSAMQANRIARGLLRRNG